MQAPYSYIRDYYRHVHRKAQAFPEVTAAWMSELRHVRGGRVLNVGCGPQLYDYTLSFGGAPRTLVGLDINESTFAFLRRSRDPRLLAAKRQVKDMGVEVEYVCADALDCEGVLGGRFDGILGVGFFATFEAGRLAKLLAVMRGALRPNGTLLKVTWHGPRRTPEETARKLKYRYDNAEEPPPARLVARFEAAGFHLRHQTIIPCDPASYGWDAIQACTFTTGPDHKGPGRRGRSASI